MSSRHVYQGEECFLVMLFHLNKGTPYTAMVRSIFGGGPRRLSQMFDIMIDHLYFTFYNKISWTSLGQWIPRHLDTCRWLIYNALADGALEESQYVNGKLINWQWIMHHFEFNTFCPFRFVDDFGLPSARPTTSVRRRENFKHDIQ